MTPNRELEASVATVESRLQALGEALRLHRAEAVETEAAELQRALAAAVEPPAPQRARSGQLSPQLRQRLALASGQVAAQRESLARASAALDRAIDVLLPSPAPRVAYSAAGLSERQTHAACCAPEPAAGPHRRSGDACAPRMRVAADLQNAAEQRYCAPSAPAAPAWPAPGVPGLHTTGRHEQHRRWV